jgi:lipoprotein-anchoring transpeptidase ErfK/SrfK
MNSVKNLLVVILLMGVSYGAFQVINTPDPTRNADAPDIEEIDIQMGPRQDLIGESSESFPSSNALPSKPAATQPAAPRTVPAPSGSAAVPDSTTLPDLPPGMSPGALETVPDLVPTLPMQASSKVATPPALPDNDFVPPVPPAASATILPGGGADTTTSSNIAGNSGPFSPNPPSNLEPVTPKPVTAGALQPDRMAAIPNQGASQYGRATDQSSRPAVDMPAATAGELDRVATIAAGPADGAAEVNYLDASGSGVSAQPSASQIPNTPPAPGATPGQIDWSGLADLANRGNVREALVELSARYNDPLPADQRMQMLQWLDQLAGKVIYSTENHLQPRPYVVRNGDTLESIAAAWNVPAQLVYNINRSKIGDNTTLQPGTELKVVEGPFNARISIDRQEMTLFLGDMYAGRFPIELGQDHEYEHGSFMIETKSPAGREYRDAAGQVIAAGAANNPYGRYWLGFSNSDLGIHEAPGMGSGSDVSGCIRLGSRDAEDIYGILSEGSQISIMR